MWIIPVATSVLVLARYFRVNSDARSDCLVERRATTEPEHLLEHALKAWHNHVEGTENKNVLLLACPAGALSLAYTGSQEAGLWQ
jgi:hypothetical protein